MQLRAILARLFGGTQQEPVAPEYAASAFCYQCQKYWYADAPSGILLRLSMVIAHSRDANHDVEIELETPGGSIVVRRRREPEVAS